MSKMVHMEFPAGWSKLHGCRARDFLVTARAAALRRCLQWPALLSTVLPAQPLAAGGNASLSERCPDPLYASGCTEEGHLIRSNASSTSAGQRKRWRHQVAQAGCWDCWQLAAPAFSGRIPAIKM